MPNINGSNDQFSFLDFILANFQFKITIFSILGRQKKIYSKILNYIYSIRIKLYMQ